MRLDLAERSNIWPAGSLEDLVTNLITNWKKEMSHKARLEDWRTVNAETYRFSCNGGRSYSAEEMMDLGSTNALIQVPRYVHNSPAVPLLMLAFSQV